MEEHHEMKATYAGFHCTCDRWKIGSWNDPRAAFEGHLEREKAAA